MAEISLAKQLSGPEALESMLEGVRQQLRMNGRFQSHMAYPGYRAEIVVRFYPAASFIPAVEQEFTVEHLTGEPGEVVSQTATVSDAIEIPVRPPNQVREEAGMPTPVLVQDENGNPVEKWVHAKGKVPKNVVKGGHVGKEPVVTMVPTAVPVPDGAA